MITFDGNEARTEFESEFGPISELSVRKLWILTKMCKHARGRCRSNAAFNNWANRLFAPAKFKEVQKEYEGRTYPGLEITKNGQGIVENEND